MADLVVELGEPVMEGHLAGAPDHQLAQRHLHTVKLSASSYCIILDIVCLCVCEKSLTSIFGSVDEIQQSQPVAASQKKQFFPGYWTGQCHYPGYWTEILS